VYEYLKGRIVLSEPTRVVVETNGVGYEIFVPLSSSAALPKDRDAVVYTHLHVREDQMKLFGFATELERKVFRYLIGITGIGPAIAITILSNVSMDDFVRAILNDDAARLRRIKGIGEKTAQRLVLEMKPVAAELAAMVPAAGRFEPRSVEEARLALISLGYTRQHADAAVKRAMQDYKTEPDTETLIKAALKHT
jgi:Holliday junction DNA helicase RuvA